MLDEMCYVRDVLNLYTSEIPTFGAFPPTDPIDNWARDVLEVSSVPYRFRLSSLCFRISLQPVTLGNSLVTPC